MGWRGPHAGIRSLYPLLRPAALKTIDTELKLTFSNTADTGRAAFEY
jgi:hypothetical protein